MLEKTLLLCAASLTLAGTALAQSAGDEEDPLAALAEMEASLQSDGPQAGGSIREQSAPPVPAVKRDGRMVFAGQVVKVLRGKRPLVYALVVRVARQPALGAHRAALRPGATVNVVPLMKKRGRGFDLRDPNTLLNFGGYFLRPGDTVMVRVAQKVNKVYRAAYIERK